MAAHLDDQQELENFKHFWQSWGRWLFAGLAAAALAYLAWVLYQNHQVSQNQEAAAVLAKMVEKAQANPEEKAINNDLQTLQQQYPNSIAAAQASMMVAANDFDKARYEVAEGHLNWVLQNQKTPFVQALAAQRLAIVQLQQKKYDAALATLNTPVQAAFEPALLETKGDVLVAQGKRTEAVAAYDAALGKLAKDAAGRELLQLKADQLK